MPLDNRPLFLTIAGDPPVRNVHLMPDVIHGMERADARWHWVESRVGNDVVRSPIPSNAQTQLALKNGAILYVQEPVEFIVRNLGGLAGTTL